jgi:hypothetical protein
VKKAETVKDVIDSEWRVVLRARELTVCCVAPRVSVRLGE